MTLLLLLTHLALAADFSAVSFEQKIGAALPLDASFVDEMGVGQTLGTLLREKPTVLVFSYFRCPNLCTLVLNGVVQAISNFSPAQLRRFSLLTLSIDPHESAPLARAKRRSY